MTNADDEMSPSDRILMMALAEALGGQRPPSDLVARCEGLLSWIDVDSELAMLLDQSESEAVGIRGAASSTVAFEFATADGSFVIEVTPSDNVLRGGLTPKRVDVDELLKVLRGQLLGGDAQQVIVRTATGVTQSLPVEESGDFVLDDAPSGAIRLELELSTDGRRIHTDWFVI